MIVHKSTTGLRQPNWLKHAACNIPADYVWKLVEKYRNDGTLEKLRRAHGVDK